MNKLVVLFCVVAAASAAPHVGVPASTTYLHGPVGVVAAPAVAWKTAPVAVATHSVAVAQPAVAVAQPVAVATPVVKTNVVVPQPPQVVETETIGHVLTKNVHYAPQPVVTGYTSTIIKPDLGAVATPAATVSQTPVAAPARAVDTVVPQITQVQPELHVQKVPVDVPVATPVVSEVEVRTPVFKAAPAVVAAPAPVAVAAAPVWTHGPAVATRLVADHGLVATHGVVAHHGVVADHGVIAGPAVIAAKH